MIYKDTIENIIEALDSGDRVETKINLDEVLLRKNGDFYIIERLENGSTALFSRSQFIKALGDIDIMTLKKYTDNNIIEFKDRRKM